MTDARFEDAGGGPLRLRAFEPDDLAVISSLAQDAVFPITELSWSRGQRRFAVLLNRYRWEANDGPERVRSVLAVEDVLAVRSQGIDRTDRDLILSLLSLDWADGRLTLILAGDGAIELTCEALEVTLRDVTRPYRAVAGKAPTHLE